VDVPRKASAIKNVRKSTRRNEINRARRSRLRKQLKRMRDLLAGKDAEGARKALPATLSLIDRSLTKGILRRNTAARYKSRLSRQVVALDRSR
jgi:small subunit ribosomal protein S20